MDKIKIGLVQMACSEDPKRNISNAEHGVRVAAKNKAALCILPEARRGLSRSHETPSHP